ncbi:MAG: glycosyltransferase family 4 protein [Acidobacteria bacterium]|nr:glycosyltransferase family 4 protein [Acidobacteriota bacterium]
MRILYCNKYNYSFSGTEAYLFELMERMRGLGHQVALFSMAGGQDATFPYRHHFVPLVDFGDGSTLARARNVPRAIYSVEARRRLRAMIAEFRPDVAHVRNIYHHLTPSILWELKAQHVPVLYHLNDFKLLCPNYNLVSRGEVCEHCRGGAFRHMLDQGCRGKAESLVLMAEAYFHRYLGTYWKCVDCFLAPSQFVRDKLVEHGWPRSAIEVLPHFQSTPATLPEAAAEDAPLLYFGRLSEEKGVADLLRAMAALPHLQLEVRGEGPQKQALQALARDWQLRNVAFRERAEGAELERSIAAARFTLFPSHAYETLGKSILESYAQGRAVVASDLGSRREFVRHEETGLLFPAGDIGKLTEAISLLAEHPETARQMGLAGRHLVATRHAPADHLLHLTELYESLCRPGHGAGPDPPLRVAFLGGRGVIGKYSGIETCYEETGSRLAARGHDITVYCRTYFTPPQKSYRGMRLVRLPTLRSKHLETFLHTLLGSLHAMFGRYDIVHYQALGPALFSFLPRLAGKRTVVTIQGLDWQRRKWGRFAAWVLRGGERAAITFPHGTIVVSRTLQDYFQRRHGAATTYVPNGTSLLQKLPTHHLQAWGLRSGEYILYLGRFSPEKNCHLLVHAYQKLDTPMKLVLAGGASYSKAYMEDLRRQQSERVVLLDWITGEPLQELLAHAALFVLPSDLEGLSLALLDAMAAGLCVLASDTPENLEAMGNAGFWFHHGNEDDLRGMLNWLLANQELRQQAGERARGRVQQHYLWEHVTQALEGLYREILAGPGTRSRVEEERRRRAA